MIQEATLSAVKYPTIWKKQEINLYKFKVILQKWFHTSKLN